MVAVPRVLVTADRVVEPLMPLTVHTPVTVTEPSATPLPFTTFTVAVPLMPVFATFRAIDSELTFIVSELDTTVIDSAYDALRPPVSDTVTVNEKLPAAEGVPEMVPPLDSASPDGRAPAVTDHVRVPEPPVAASDVV